MSFPAIYIEYRLHSIPRFPHRTHCAGLLRGPHLLDLTGKEVRPEGCPTLEKDCRPDGRQSEKAI